MKKQYIKPSVKAHNVKISTILAGSQQQVEYGGSNKGTGNTSADSKAFQQGFDFMDEE